MVAEKKGCLAPDCHTAGQQAVSGHKEHNPKEALAASKETTSAFQTLLTQGEGAPD